MRLLCIDQYFSTRRGISGTRWYEFGKRMVQEGHQVTFITTASRYSSLYPQKKWITRLDIEGMKVISLRIPYSHLMGFGKRMLSFLSFMFFASILGVFQKRHDLVMATSTPLSVGLPGLIISWIRGTPFVFEVRDLWPRAPIELGILKNPVLIFLLKKFEKLLYRHASQIIALSPGMAEGIADTGIDATKITIIPNACDLDLFDALPSKKKLRKKLNLKDEFIVVYAGTVGIANNLIYLVDMADAIKKAKTDSIRFMVIGEGNELEMIKQEVKKRKIQSIDFQDAMPREKVAEYIAAADCGLTMFINLPLLETNSPNKWFDYLAAGIPTANNMAGWTKQYLVKFQTGIFLPPDNPSQAAEKIISLAKDQARAKKLGENSKKLAHDHFSRGLLFGQITHVFKKAASNFSPSLESTIKSAIDFFGGLIASIILSPILIAISLAIKIESPGPVFFVQKRAGRNGLPFRMYKFRTMVHGADQIGLGLNVEGDDSRITRVGHFLRNWSLDELAQIFNILLLQMSFIGPRPMLLEQAEKLDQEQKKRLLMRPGITGLSQVSGRNLLSWTEKIEKDIEYVSNFSLLLDLKIFLKTFGVIISKKGLYEPGAGLEDKFNKLEAPNDE